MTRPHDTRITYRYTSPQFAQDCRNLVRMRRHDARIAWLKRLGWELLIKAIVPAVGFALIMTLTRIT